MEPSGLASASSLSGGGAAAAAAAAAAGETGAATAAPLGASGCSSGGAAGMLRWLPTSVGARLERPAVEGFGLECWLGCPGLKLCVQRITTLWGGETCPRSPKSPPRQAAAFSFRSEGPLPTSSRRDSVARSKKGRTDPLQAGGRTALLPLGLPRAPARAPPPTCRRVQRSVSAASCVAGAPAGALSATAAALFAADRLPPACLLPHPTQTPFHPPRPARKSSSAHPGCPAGALWTGAWTTCRWAQDL